MACIDSFEQQRDFDLLFGDGPADDDLTQAYNPDSNTLFWPAPAVDDPTTVDGPNLNALFGITPTVDDPSQGSDPNSEEFLWNIAAVDHSTQGNSPYFSTIPRNIPITSDPPQGNGQRSDVFSGSIPVLDDPPQSNEGLDDFIKDLYEGKYDYFSQAGNQFPSPQQTPALVWPSSAPLESFPQTPSQTTMDGPSQRSTPRRKDKPLTEEEKQRNHQESEKRRREANDTQVAKMFEMCGPLLEATDKRNEKKILATFADMCRQRKNTQRGKLDRLRQFNPQAADYAENQLRHHEQVLRGRIFKRGTKKRGGSGSPEGAA